MNREFCFDNEILAFNARGLVPLAQESEDQYLARCRSLKTYPDLCPMLVETLYGCKPDWIEVRNSNSNLSPWEAAATFYDEEDHSVSIQLRRAFLTKKRYLGLYDKEEVLAHEYIHAVRFPLQSEKYEEFFAYYIAAFFGSKFRAYWGPLFTKPSDALVFTGAALAPFAAFFVDVVDPLFFLAIPIGITAFFATRLISRWRRWKSCQEKVGLPLMIRLTDEEIDLFAQLSSSEIKAYAEEQSKVTLRWKLLSFMYCK